MLIEGTVIREEDGRLVYSIPSLALKLRQSEGVLDLDGVAQTLRRFLKEKFVRSEFQLSAIRLDDQTFAIRCSDPKLLLSFILFRLRTVFGISQRDAAHKRGRNSQNSWLRKESGRHDPGVITLDLDVQSLNLGLELVLSVASSKKADSSDPE